MVGRGCDVVVRGGGGAVVGAVVGCGGSEVSTTESVAATVGAVVAELVGGVVGGVVAGAVVESVDDGADMAVVGGPVVVGTSFMANGNGFSGVPIVPSPVDTVSRHSAAVAAPRIAPTANRPRPPS